MESATAPERQHHSSIRILAHIVSVIFHPLFISSYVAAFLIFLHPYAFAGNPERLKVFRLIMVFFNTAFIPAFSVFLMWRLGLIESIFLKTTRERIIPYISAMICYWWAWYVTSNNPDNPEYFVDFMLGAFIAVCITWFCNIYFKVSMHTTAAGGAMIYFLIQAFFQYEPTGVYFSVSLIIAGLVGTARLIVSDHRPSEIYAGYIIGAVSQLVAWWL